MKTVPVFAATVIAALVPFAAAAQSTEPETDAVPVVTQPAWEKQPRPDYPEIAMSQKIVDGRAVVECTALATGEVGDCVVIEETPQGAGFGPAVVRAASRARLWTQAPGYVANARFRFATNFAMR